MTLNQPEASDSEFSVILLVAVSILWVPVIERLQGGQLYLYIQGVAACLAPPIAAVYLLAVLWKRCSEPGAFYALMTGLITGLIRLVLTVVYHEPVCGEPDHRPAIVARFHYMYFALFSFLLTGLVMIVVSLFTRPPDKHCLTRLTYFTAWDVPEEYSPPVPKDCQAVNAYGISEAYDKPTGDAMLAYGLYDPAITEQPRSGSPRSLQRNEIVDVHEPSPDKLCPCHSPAGLCFRHICLWLCGCEDHPCSQENEFRCAACLCCGKSHVPDWLPFGHERTVDLENEEQHLRSVISLKQDPRAKVALRVCLVFLAIIVIFLYVFFSVYFDLIDPGPLPVWWNESANVTRKMLLALEANNIITLK
ncbi:unnamed protein product [Echinostoma caproni]|uniref:Transmembrane protein n=1 Tax=Echinostoma caproni TaxID=27848 RepID=A0A183ANF6_9TREM|nr:unnamed protein product [Echinostoma caproni]